MQNADTSSQSQGIFTGWYAQPFQSGMNALHWVLFLGLVIIAAFLWTRVLNLIEV